MFEAETRELFRDLLDKLSRVEEQMRSMRSHYKLKKGDLDELFRAADKDHDGLLGSTDVSSTPSNPFDNL